jgi:hypothetical protein
MSQHVIAKHGRVRIVRGVWDSIVQIRNASGEEWLDYGAVGHDVNAAFIFDFSMPMQQSFSWCYRQWLDAPDSECSEVAADALAARDDVLPS